MWPSLTTRQGLSRALALAVVAAAIVLRAFDPGPVALIRHDGFDLMQRHWPRQLSDTDRFRVAIVEIDDDSLRTYGQWPWPRHRLAELVRRIADGRPRVLGIDILFDEPDRWSPPGIVSLPDLPAGAIPQLRNMPSGDARLADALRAVPSVLAIAPDRDAPAGSAGFFNSAPVLQAGGSPIPYLAPSDQLPPILPGIAAAARSIGSIGYNPDPDGVVRRVPLAIVERQRIIPSFALEVLRIAEGAPLLLIRTGPHGIEGFRFGGLEVPTDPHGNALLHIASSLTYHISAGRILAGRYDVSQLQGNIVLLGVTGLGLLDQRETPLDLMQGIDIHAQLIESMLLSKLLHRPWNTTWIELNAMLAAGLVTIWLLPFNRPPLAAGFAAAIVALLLGAELLLFRYFSVLFDGVYPAMTTLAAFGVMLGSALRAAEAALSRERELRQRQEGELAAAQAIQMGLLPRHYPAFPDRPDIDLSARIEPARMVGGDFYEYMLVDHDRRLFFLIADVSDKGIPAALFMALTKEIVHDAVLRFAPSLGLILAEVNRRTTEASRELPSYGGDMMFVTAFAGILDLESGAVTYASAGHDPPFVIGGNRGLRKLVTEGGPPLGAVDPFPFPIDRDRIAPGEVLLLYTDGITEAQNADRALYSGERLERVLKTAAATDAERVITAVVDDVRRFVGEADQADDITLLALRRAG